MLGLAQARTLTRFFRIMLSFSSYLRISRFSAFLLRPSPQAGLLTSTLANLVRSHAGQQLENISLYACAPSPGLELAPASLTLAKQHTQS